MRKTADAVVIGGGIVGASIAYYGRGACRDVRQLGGGNRAAVDPATILAASLHQIGNVNSGEAHPLSAEIHGPPVDDDQRSGKLGRPSFPRRRESPRGEKRAYPTQSKD